MKFEHEKIVYEYWRSSLIPAMLFDEEEDADSFDCFLEAYTTTLAEDAKKEIMDTLNYSCWAAVVNAIENEDVFPEGTLSDELCTRCENMSCADVGSSIESCYVLTMRYVLGKLFPKETDPVYKNGYYNRI